MPSDTMDFNSFSSSLHSSQDICSSTEWPAGLWKSDKMQKGFDSDLGIKPSLSTQAISKFSDAKEVNIVGAQHECSLFSSSLSELFSRKLRLPTNDDLYGRSVDTVAPHYEDERVFGSVEELEAQFIGNLLPSDDELLSGVTDGYEHIIRDGDRDDMDELDLFSSVGGLDLGDGDSSSSGEKNWEILGGACKSQPGTCNTSIAGENSYGEHPSRTLFVKNISSDDGDSELKALFEQFGDIHTFSRSCEHRGFVMISYYDIRASQSAMRAIQNGIFTCKKFDIHYSIPKDSPSKKDVNQGTLAVFLYDSSISNTKLHQIFNVYGEIKEIREIPHSRGHWLVEFYDSRAADGALHALNRNDTTRKRLKVEPYQFRDSSSVTQQIDPEVEQKECSICLHQKSPPLKSTTSFPGLHVVDKSGIRILGGESTMSPPTLETAFIHGISSSVPKTLPSLVRVKSVGSQYENTESNSPCQLNSDIQATLAFRPHSLPECHLGSGNGVHRNPFEVAANINHKTQERTNNMQFSPGNGSFPLPPGNHYKWSNSYQPPGMMWPNSASYFDGISAAPTLQRLHQLPSSPSHMVSTALSNNRHVQSASLGDRRYTYAGESPDASAFHPGSFGNMPFSSNIAAHGVDFVPPNIFPHFGLQFHNQRGLLFPGRNHMVDSFDNHKRVRSRRNGVSNLNDMKQYELNIDRIKTGEDKRTTLMIKNIPNKYTSKMLLAAIDERHKGTYDFVYLPIDFKNKCNVGYAFINMTSPSLIIPFYQVFDGKKWEKFNSEKVASLAYARIQGKTALISHFQNSSLMNEDKRCRPILINTDGPNAGDQVPFPVSVNVGNKPGRVRSNTHEVNLHGEPA